MEEKAIPAILFAGNLKELPEVSPFISQGKFVHAETVQDAVIYAQNDDFDIVIIGLDSLEPKVEKSLKTFAIRNPDIRIILLVQMYEEPIAIRMVNSKETELLNCEYHIAPLHPDELTEIIFGRKISQQTSPISQNKDARIRMLEKLATEDDLTGIKNRRYIREFLNQILEKASKEDMQVTLLIFDIDDFKHYNDTFGHNVGDEILIEVSKLMQKCCRSQDVVGRIGGDEFAVIFWDCNIEASKENQDRRATFSNHPTEAQQIAKRYLAELNKADFVALGKRGKGKLTVSGGLATFPKDGLTVGELFEKADEALLDAKREGKNRIFLVDEPE